MATLINQTQYTLVIGETVISTHQSAAAAERRGRKETRPGCRHIIKVIPPGRPFTGHSWFDCPSVNRWEA